MCKNKFLYKLSLINELWNCNNSLTKCVVETCYEKKLFPQSLVISNHYFDRKRCQAITKPNNRMDWWRNSPRCSGKQLVFVLTVTHAKNCPMWWQTLARVQAITVNTGLARMQAITVNTGLDIIILIWSCWFYEKSIRIIVYKNTTNRSNAS